MSSPALSIVLLSALAPVATALLGAVYAAFRPPRPALRSAIQHFAAGVVFAVVAVELLPDVTRVHTPVENGVSFAAGVALMLTIRAFSNRNESRGGSVSDPTGAAASVGQLVAVGIDILLDGVLVGIAFAAGSREGMLLTLALSLELLSVSLAVAAGVRATRSAARAIMTPTALALLLVVGAAVGDTVLRGASPHLLAGVLAFGCAALLYLVTEELLVEAHEAAETTLASAMFFAGFLALLLLGMME